MDHVPDSIASRMEAAIAAVDAAEARRKFSALCSGLRTMGQTITALSGGVIVHFSHIRPIANWAMRQLR